MKNNDKFEIVFYEDKNGKSDIYDFIENLRLKSLKSKDARIQYRQVSLYIELLANNGSILSSDIMKKLSGDIWELRPGHNRVLYFFYKDNKYVLLHHFIKKTQKTPKKEIDRAIKEMNDYIERMVK